MVLNKLVINNFRQFRGVQNIVFFNPNIPSKNITVIMGKNGSGKTSIFRAIMFCLYGDIILPQDEGIDKKELYLINTNILIENEGASESFIELHFSHNKQTYFLKRTIKGIIKNKQRHEQMESVQLKIIKKDGNTEIIDQNNDITIEINKIINKDIREYFLFDGEKIQRLTLASSEQKKEVSKGIRKLLNIESLEKSINILNELKKKLNIEVSKKATGEYAKVINQIQDIEDNINLKDEDNKLYENELIKAEIEKKEVDKRLEDYNEIRDFLKERKRLEEALEIIIDNINNLLLDIKNKSRDITFLIIKKTISKVFKQLNEKTEKGELPSEIRKDLIERLLENKRCICGRDIVLGENSFDNIIIWKNKTCEFELEKSALDIWRYLSGINDRKGDIAGKTQTLLINYGNEKNKYEKISTRIEEINDLIGNSERKDAADLERHREKIEEKISSLKIKIELEIQERNILFKDKEQLISKKKKLEKNENLINELVERYNLTSDTYDSLNNLHNDFTLQMKTAIAEETNEYFHKLLDKEGKRNLGKIIVNDDYSLQILDKWDNAFLANISAGQRQIMSISFITALAAIASNKKTLEIPFFMDTPFGRLSVEHRKNLLNNIPELCSQWILLVTDTEFTNVEKKILNQNDKWGKYYELRSEAQGNTLIEEKKIDNY